MASSLLLILLAILPPAILMFLVYKFDKIEREPLSLLLSLFFLGAVSCIPASLAEWIGEMLLSAFGLEGYVGNFLYAIFVVALAEEGFKYLFTKLVSWKHTAFNYRFDGIVYTVFTSLGFALAENVLYVTGEGVGTAFVRAISAVPLHASCGVVMGIFYGFAKGCDYAGNQIGKRKNVRKAIWFPVLIHGFYDFCLFTQNDLLMLVWILFTVVVFVVVFIRVRYYSKSDHPIVSQNNNRFFGMQGSLFNGFDGNTYPINNQMQQGKPGFAQPGQMQQGNAGFAQPGQMQQGNFGFVQPQMRAEGYQGMAGGQFSSQTNGQVLGNQGQFQNATAQQQGMQNQRNEETAFQNEEMPQKTLQLSDSSDLQQKQNLEVVTNQNGNLEYFSKN